MSLPGRHDAGFWRLAERAALGAALLLLIASFGAMLYSENLYQAQKLKEVRVQAEILADGLTAPLAFGDDRTAQEYVNALRANPDIRAAGVYNSEGRLVAAYSAIEADPLPDSMSIVPPFIAGNRAVATVPIQENESIYGTVYLRVVTLPLTGRLLRYGVMAMLVFFAALVVAVLGVAHTAMRRANADLDQRANDLAAANTALKVQIEERERAEQALRQSQKMEAKGQLVGGVAHDFNNLLMAVSSGLHLLGRAKDEKRRNVIMEGISQAVDRGSSLTRQLLAFARRQTLKPETFDPASRIEGMQELLQRSLREDIEVRIDMPDDLWPVRADAGQFELVILNLAVNARDAMPNGGALIINGRNEPADQHGADTDMVRLSVADTGAGMDEDTLARAFEPFFTTKEVDKGTGLGLAQAYGFASQSEGWADIESTLGEGTTVHLRLPRSRETIEEVATHAEQYTESRRAASRRHILIVEDDDTVAAMVCALIEELGHDCQRVSSAAAALETLEGETSFDLLFSDIVMPGGMNGIELARKVKKARPELPVILTTGYSEEAHELPTETAVLRKPYEAEDLGAALDAAFVEKESV